MKQAHLPDGSAITAAAAAPGRARCPHCGAAVALRQRRRMDGRVSHFWRHIEPGQRCPGRTRPYCRNGR